MKTSLKTCFRCGNHKPITEFYKHPQMADGHLNKCKECNKRDVKERYNSPRGRKAILRYERARSQTPERRAMKLEYQKQARRRNPEKNVAHQKLAYAIRTGKLAPQPCEVCGAKAEGHHDDYAKPLDVRWLCFRCHREHAHGQIVGLVKHQTLPLRF
jgi:hypothetical protein